MSDASGARDEAPMRWAGGWFLLAVEVLLVGGVLWFDVSWSQLHLIPVALGVHQLGQAWRQGSPPWRRPRGFRGLRPHSTAWFGSRRESAESEARVYVSVGLGVRAFSLSALAAVTVAGVPLAGQVANGEVPPAFAAVWFAFLGYGLYFFLAIWPQQVAVHHDGTMEFRALLRTHRWLARDLSSIRLVGSVDDPGALVFKFGLNDVTVKPVPIDYSDLVSRCERMNPEISVVRSWHA
jgi:hypothetical protein